MVESANISTLDEQAEDEYLRENKNDVTINSIL